MKRKKDRQLICIRRLMNQIEFDVESLKINLTKEDIASLREYLVKKIEWLDQTPINGIRNDNENKD